MEIRITHFPFLIKHATECNHLSTYTPTRIYEAMHQEVRTELCTAITRQRCWGDVWGGEAKSSA
jgi:hypothetical protein